MWRRRGLAVALLVFWAAPLVCAQEGKRPVAEIEELRRIDALSDEKHGTALALLGKVTLEREKLFSVRASAFIFWIDPEAEDQFFKLIGDWKKDKGQPFPAWALRAVYAEGEGKVPAVFQVAGRIYRCSSFYYDFRSHRGVFLDAEVRLRYGRPGRDVPLAVRAKMIISPEPGTITAENVTLFSSPYRNAAFSIRVKNITLTDPALAKALGELMRVTARPEGTDGAPSEAEIDAALDAVDKASSPTGGTKTLRLKKPGLYAFGKRLIPLPSTKWSSANQFPLIVEAGVGSRGELNTEIRLGVGMDMEWDSGTRFRWIVGGGIFTDRGPFLDLNTYLRTVDGKLWGRSFGIFLHDHGDDFGITPPTRDRYWTMNQYRWQLSPAWRLDFEYDLLSDPLFLRVYDERQFKEGKEQETLAYFRRKGDSTYLTLLTKWRTIDFLPTLEQLPSFTADLPVWTLFKIGRAEVQLAGGIAGGNFRFREGNLGLTGDFRAARFDVDPTLYISFGVGPFRIVPFATFRYTAWERTPGSEDWQHRYAGSAGIRVDTQAARWYGRQRHLMNINVEYVDLYSLTRDPTEFFPFDEVDLVDLFERLSVRWRNRFQKRTKTGMYTYLDIELLALYYPEKQQPESKRGTGYTEWDVVWAPHQRFELLSQGSVNVETEELETASIGTKWWTPAGRAYGIVYKHLQGDSDVITGTAELTVGARWRLLVFSQFDLRNNDALDQDLRIQRLGHTFYYEVRLSYDPGGGDFRFGIQFDLIERLRRKPNNPVDTGRSTGPPN